MKTKGMLFLAVALVVVGAVGLIATVASVPSGVPGAFSSDGQRIYYTGRDATGPIPRTVPGAGFAGFGMMDAAACVNCHGEDGRGGRIGMMMFGTIDVPDIRYSTLTTARSEGGKAIPAWTDADIARAIRDGVEPDGQRLKAPMPRWGMTDADVSDVIAYLKELSRR
jgi:cytochrome c oxidase subunit 2